jgi:hypothetical protein
MFRFLFALIFVLGGTSAAYAASSHLWNDGMGSGQCLDVVNDGVNEQVRMASCAEVSGQHGELSRLRGPGQAFQLTNRFPGPSRCLEATSQWSSECQVAG